MNSVADFMVAGMRLTGLPRPPYQLPDGARDVLSGERIAQGYALWDIMPDSAGEYLDTLHGGVVGYLSDSSARALKGCWNMGSWLIFEDGTGYHPLIAAEAADQQGRACWSRLVRQVWRERAGQSCLCILTTDTKKRVWTRARIGVLGTATDVFIHDAECARSGNFLTDWPGMLTMLDEIERLYRFGFAKPTIRRSLLSDLRKCQLAGLSPALEWERVLSDWRGQPEFDFALTIAQKEGQL